MGRYGDSVHDVYFGKPMDAALKGEIIAAVTSAAEAYPSLSNITAQESTVS